MEAEMRASTPSFESGSELYRFIRMNERSQWMNKWEGLCFNCFFLFNFLLFLWFLSETGIKENDTIHGFVPLFLMNQWMHIYSLVHHHRIRRRSYIPSKTCLKTSVRCIEYKSSGRQCSFQVYFVGTRLLAPRHLWGRSPTRLRDTSHNTCFVREKQADNQ